MLCVSTPLLHSSALDKMVSLCASTATPVEAFLSRAENAVRALRLHSLDSALVVGNAFRKECIRPRYFVLPRFTDLAPTRSSVYEVGSVQKRLSRQLQLCHYDKNMLL